MTSPFKTHSSIIALHFGLGRWYWTDRGVQARTPEQWLVWHRSQQPETLTLSVSVPDPQLSSL